MRKVRGVCIFLFILIGIIVAIIFGNSQKNIENLETFHDSIRNSAYIKLEYCNDNEPIIVEDVYLLSSYFMDINLTESNDEMQQWIYKITFNTDPVYQEDNEIVVLVSDNLLSIDGIYYTTDSNQISVNSIIKYLDIKYAYYKEQSSRNTDNKG